MLRTKLKSRSVSVASSPLSPCLIIACQVLTLPLPLFSWGKSPPSHCSWVGMLQTATSSQWSKLPSQPWHNVGNIVQGV